MSRLAEMFCEELAHHERTVPVDLGLAASLLFEMWKQRRMSAKGENVTPLPVTQETHNPPAGAGRDERERR